LATLAGSSKGDTDIAFDESRFLDIAKADVPSSSESQTSSPAETARVVAPPIDPDHLDLGPLPPPPEHFSFRELMRMAGPRRDPLLMNGAPTQSAPWAATWVQPKSSDKFIRELITNMKQMAQLEDPAQDKLLHESLGTIKDQIVYLANNIKTEKEWVNNIAGVVRVYGKKVMRVSQHIKKLVTDAKIAFRKHQYILNMIVQRRLSKQLKLLRADLEVIHAALQNVKNKDPSFKPNSLEVKQQIGLMEDTLRELRSSQRKEEKKILDRLRQGKSAADDSSSESSSKASESSKEWLR